MNNIDKKIDKLIIWSESIKQKHKLTNQCYVLINLHTGFKQLSLKPITTKTTHTKHNLYFKI